MVEQCEHCKHLRPLSGGCAAYPDGMPYKFSSDLEEHNKVEPDQKGGAIFEAGEPDELKGLAE